MPRATRSGNTPKATPKSPTKKKTPVTKVTVSTKSEPRSKGGAQSEAEEPITKTPTRSLRKREILKSPHQVEEEGEVVKIVTPSTSPSSVPSKRRRVSGSGPSSSTHKTSHSQPTEPVSVGCGAVQSKKTSPRQSKNASSSRKRLGTSAKVEDSPDYPTSNIGKTATKRAKISQASPESGSIPVMSPTVLVSPLKTPISQQASDHDLSPRVRLTSKATAKPTTRNIGEEETNTENQESAATIQHLADNGIGVVSQSPVQLQANFTPKPQLNKRELATIQRCQLLQRLDHYDLSDIASLGSLLSDWPEVDARYPTSVNALIAEKIAATHRIWVSERIPMVENGNSNHIYNVHFNDNGGVDDELTIAKKMRTDDADTVAMKAKSTPTNNNVGETNVEATVNDTDMGSFCVASFVLPTAKTLSGKENEAQLQQDEHERILREVTAINPDVFCVKNARPDYASGKLRPELTRLGYMSSPCPEGDAFAYRSFIFYNRDVFSELSFHHIPVQAMAKKLVSRSAYPQSWRDSLTHSLENNTYSTKGSSPQPSPELIISTLRHISSGSILLFGCLTEKQCTQATPTISSPDHPLLFTPTPTVNNCSDWNRMPNVMRAFCASTTTVSVSKPGCAVSTSSYGGEWCPPSFDSRPDLAAINAAGSLWALHEVWDEVVEAVSVPSGINGICDEGGNPVHFQNGYQSSANRSSPESQSRLIPQQPFRWVLCTNLEAAPTSPVYQIFRDGYPTDESLTRLKTVRNIHLQNHDYMDGTSLIDMLWHAFQHPCTDVLSCYDSVLGREPPFTRFTEAPELTSDKQLLVVPRKCIDYIFCSNSSLKPKSVFLPPCRAVTSTLCTSDLSPHQRPTVSAPWRSEAALTETSFPLAARLSLKCPSSINAA